MVIVEKKLSELQEYENNPRNNAEAVCAVANSIREFGFKVPIVIDSKNIIIAGHTRRRAAEMLGLETVPCIVADDLTEEQIKAFRLADNKTGELAGWDFEKLEAELSEIQFDMSGFGFDISNDNINIDDFFESYESENSDSEEETDSKTEQEQDHTKIKCPHCGEWFEA